ncbi:hypothetical protein VTJ83DRAFT_4656 [Remersonia thermophila]|uniref:Uncharacterized protein n=1 Tax=Remersonia thermophila TaxID=72144 RepID=A0ABR4DBH6_9PEZI
MKYYSVRSAALAALCVSPLAATAYQTVPEGPDMLDECGACPYLYSVFHKCQQVVGDARQCVCPDSVNTEWYAYIDACQGCLRYSSSHDFWRYFTSVSFSLLHHCRASSTSIIADGQTLCVSDDRAENCLSLRDSSQGASRVSHKSHRYPQNNMDVSLSLNLAVVRAALTPSTTAASSTTSAPATTAKSSDADKASTTTSASEADSTDSTDASTTPTPTGTDGQAPVPGAAARFGASSMGWALGMVMVAAFGLL